MEPSNRSLTSLLISSPTGLPRRGPTIGSDVSEDRSFTGQTNIAPGARLGSQSPGASWHRAMSPSTRVSRSLQAHTAGIVAILIGATIVFFLFPRKDGEARLLAEYHEQDTEPAEIA